MLGMTVLQIPGGLGGMELAVILLIAILLFGANKIPKLARSTGQAMGEFKRGREEIEQELQEIEDAATLDTGGNEGEVTATETSQEQGAPEEAQEASAAEATAESESDGESTQDEA